jgi:myo-inositol 2-dehydrogenase/D-chiro-inositol 1-dehydrogenase
MYDEGYEYVLLFFTFSNMINLGLLGIGRIGKIHLANVVRHFPGARVVAAMNPSEAGRSFARSLNVPLVTDQANDVLNHPEVDAVLICTATDAHADYVVAAARAGKAIFCEKPLDLSLSKVKWTLDEVNKAGVPLMLAFNQRLDPSFQEVKNAIVGGHIGELRSIHIISRDPAPPPVTYIRSSGGLFLDMSIHDFDMARYLAGAEVEDVFAKGFNLVDPAIGEAGDIDTGYIVISFKNRVTALIENSRQASYGYDQRLEAFGSKGMVRAENPLKTTTRFLDGNGVHLSRNLDFFIDRYADSYLLELSAFLDALRENKPMPITGEDGLQAMLIALAANKSMQENRPVRIREVR